MGTVDPDAQRALKADAISTYLWRMGITDVHAILDALPYRVTRGSGMHRGTPTVCALAREAYTVAGDTTGLQVPSSPQSRTWDMVQRDLDEYTEKAAAWEPTPRRDLLDRAARWLPPAPSVTDATSPGRGVDAEPAPTSSASTTGPPTGEREPVSRDKWPHGWDQLVAQQKPLDGVSCVHHPERPAIVNTRDGGRCPDCPPVLGEWFHVQRTARGAAVSEWVRRDGWGCLRPSVPGGPRSVNWAPPRTARRDSAATKETTA